MSKRERDEPPTLQYAAPEVLANPLPGLDPEPKKKRKSRWGDDPAPTALPGVLGGAGGLADSVAAARSAALKSTGALPSASNALVMGAPATGTLTAITDPIERRNRRLYIGNLPPGTSGLELLAFLNEGLIARNPGMQGLAVSNAQVNSDKCFAFVDAASVDFATQTIVYFDNMLFKGANLKVRRPRDYVPPPEGDPAERMKRTVSHADLPPPVPQHETEGEVPEGPHRIFIGNLNPIMRADAVKDVLAGCGDLKAFHMVMEKPDSELNAGYAFVEYADPSITHKAVSALRGLRVGGRNWAVCRTLEGLRDEEAAGRVGQLDYSVPAYIKSLTQKPTKVLEITGFLSGPEEAAALEEDEDRLRELEEDLRTECKRFGRVRSLHIPRPKDHERFAREAAAQATAGMPLMLTSGGEAKGAEPEFKPLAFVKSTEVQQPDFTEQIEVKPAQAATSAPADESMIPPPPPDEREAGDEDEEDKPSTSGQAGDANGEESKPQVQEKVWGLGKAYVEFMRPETCAEVAHNLHGRTFEGRALSCSFFPVKLYQKNTRKGREPATKEEKIQRTLAVQAKLLDTTTPLITDKILGHVPKLPVGGGSVPAPGGAPASESKPAVLALTAG